MGKQMSKKQRRTLARSKAEYADRQSKAQRDGVRFEDLPRKKKHPSKPKKK